MTDIHPTSLTLTGGEHTITIETTSCGYRSGIRQAPQLTVAVADPGTIIRHPLLRAVSLPDEAGGFRPAAVVGGRTWRLRRILRHGHTLTLTLWEQPAARLDPPTSGPALSVQGTVVDLAARLCDAAGVPLHADAASAATPATTVERSDEETGWAALGREVDELDGWVRFIGDTPDGRGLLLGPTRWAAARTPPVRISETDPTVDPIGFDISDGQVIDQVTLGVTVDGWDGIAPPGQAVELVDDFPLDPTGWLVETIDRDRLHGGAAALTLTRHPAPKETS